MRPLTPDAGEVFRLWALTVPAITAITGTRVGIRLQGPEPAIRYSAVGGTDGVNPGQSVPRVQADCWGRGAAAGSGLPVDDGTASLLARTLVAALPAGEFRTAAGVITQAWVDGLPFESNDPQSQRPRFIVQVRLDVYPPE